MCVADVSSTTPSLKLTLIRRPSNVCMLENTVAKAKLDGGRARNFDCGIW